MFFSFLHGNILCWYSLEAPRFLMSTHNICFCGEIRKISIVFVEIKCLPGAMSLRMEFYNIFNDDLNGHLL